MQQAELPELAAERRLLVPKVVGDGYELEDPDFAPIDGARADFGEIEGTGYRIELPEQWNGELVLWAHGFRGLNDEGTGFSRRLTFDEIPARDVIIGQGYGWATSTYRVNGYVPGIGVDDLLRVKDRVAEIARPARSTYIAGGSMGRRNRAAHGPRVSRGSHRCLGALSRDGQCLGGRLHRRLAHASSLADRRST